MSFRNPTANILRQLPKRLNSSRCLCKHKPQYLQSLQFRQISAQQRPKNPWDENEEGYEKKERLKELEEKLAYAPDAIARHRIDVALRKQYKRRAWISGIGFVFGMIAIWVTATSIDLPSEKPIQADSGARPNDPLVVLGKERKVVVQKLGEEPEEIPDVVPTGTSTVPTFPRLLEFFDSPDGNIDVADSTKLAEYQLLGLGIRTVSFLGVQVYVVGMYVATDDIAALQQALIRKVDPIATTLVADEKDKLRELLFDAGKGEEVWSSILKDSGVRTLVRIVPTRDTDFHHLRDAWVRSITNRALKNREEFGDEAFGASVAAFKTLFTKGSVPKTKELLLSRDPKGKLAVWYDNGKTGAVRLGEVEDERISRSVWLNYLGGKTVASEGARKSIIDGVMEFVERPVGTVATQVHV